MAFLVLVACLAWPTRFSLIFSNYFSLFYWYSCVWIPVDTNEDADEFSRICLSMHSNLFKRFLKTFKIGGASIIFTFWCKLPENDEFSEECHTMETYYLPSYDNVDRRIPENQQMLVHNNRLLVGSKGKNFEVDSALTFQKKLKTLEQITLHLLEIFYVERFNLESRRKKTIWNGIFDEEEKKNFYDLYGLSPEQTKFLFNEAKTDRFSFLGHISNSEELTGIQLKHRKAKFWIREELDWVTMNHVIDSESEELCVKLEDVETDKIVELLKKWQSGKKLVNLEKLDLIIL